MNEFHEYTTARKVLEQRQVGATVRQSMRFETREDHLHGELERRISAYVLTDHVADDTFTAVTRAEWPASTWQMFKHRHVASWWLGWLVRRRPVRMQVEVQHVEVEVSRYLGYPEADLRLPELGRPVIFETPRQIRP